MDRDDIDDIIQNIFQVIDLDDPRLRERLKRGLERGFEVATTLGHDVKVDIELDGDSPDVVVLDGGKGDDPTSEEERAQKTKPDLSVVDEPHRSDDQTDDLDLEDMPDPFDDLDTEAVRVRVLGSRRSDTVGHIDVSDDMQTVFRGASPRVYRLHCEDGGFRILLDGMPVDGISGGQSIDVEAALIQVRGDGEGTYVALRGNRDG